LTTWLDALRELDPAFPLDELAPGTTVADLLALHARTEPPRGFLYYPAAVYDAELRLSMHLYAPQDTMTTRPGVLFVHGGGWGGGCATWHLRQACALAEQGYVAATIDYRLAPGARWPAPLEDVKRAVRWLKARGPSLGLDPDRLVIAGGSAGGHLAALVALTPGRFEPDARPQVSSAVAGAVLWYPVLDLPSFAGVKADVAGISVATVIENFLGASTEALLQEASPSTYVGPASPPILTLTGERDELTPAAHIEPFHRALSAAGVRNRLIVVPGKGHQFDLYPGDWEDSFAETLAFLSETVGAPP
jgi:acetyl esterase